MARRQRKAEAVEIKGGEAGRAYDERGNVRPADDRWLGEGTRDDGAPDNQQGSGDPSTSGEDRGK